MLSSVRTLRHTGQGTSCHRTNRTSGYIEYQGRQRRQWDLRSPGGSKSARHCLQAVDEKGGHVDPRTPLHLTRKLVQISYEAFVARFRCRPPRLDRIRLELPCSFPSWQCQRRGRGGMTAPGWPFSKWFRVELFPWNCEGDCFVRFGKRRSVC